MKIGDKVLLDKDHFENERQEEVPVGTSLKFTAGFIIRQHDESGVGGYGCPTKNFWTVAFLNQNGVPGILLPEGDEKYNARSKGEERLMVSKIHHEAIFVPLKNLRNVSLAKIVALPEKA